MRSLFSRQVALLTVLILLVLTFLGGAFQLGMTSYLENQKENTLSGNAQAVADLTRAYGSTMDLATSWDFRMSVSLAARVANTDAVICAPNGTVLVCSCNDFSCGHLGAKAAPEYVAKILADGQQYSTGTLPGLYQDNRYIQARHLLSHSGRTLGIVIVSAPMADTTAYLRSMFRIFFYTALVVWLIAVLVTFFISRHESRPLKEMVKTVSRFGHGDMTARANVSSGSTREMEELAAAFNNMADSLEKADNMRSEFVANVSHELKTPMTSIAGYLDGMLDGTIPQEMHPHYMGIVAEEVRRLSRLVRSMLEISRMQAEGMDETRLSRFELGDAVGQTLLTFEQKIREKRLEVNVLLPEKDLYTVAHRDSILQVIYNLVENAVKFSNDCGYLTLSVRQEGSKAFVCVKNTGPTIPADQLPLIFHRFHKLDKSRSKDPSGVGLGLYIVKTIIGAHGEEIWVESHDGVTAFTFTLPAVK